MASNRPTNDLDKSLLDRLNALKSTSVTLDAGSKLGPLNPPSTSANDTAQVKPSFAIGPVPSVSKEDALTERLRVLRNASSSSVPSSAASGSGQAPAAASPNPELVSRAEGHGSSQSPFQRGETPVSRNNSQQPPRAEDIKAQTQTHILSSAWSLEEVDDQALDELLEGLQDDLNLQEDVPAEDEEDVDLHAVANNNDGDDGIIENDEERVQKLLSELAPKPNNNSFADGHDDNSDDDSDGEAMTKETNKILDQVQDEISLHGPTNQDTNNTTDDTTPFSLPSPPSGTRTPTFTSQPTSPNNTNNTLNLPTVPSTLSPPSGEEQDPNDITSLTARLSHLRSTPIKTDAFGLPSVPTTTLILPADSSLPSSFSPFGASRPSSGLASTKYQTKSTKGWVGRGESYTDEDVRRWCKVCLEDATIRCEGCDDDGYCTRCWREMHVGPGAGWEERGHRWFRLGGKGDGKGTGDWSGPTTPM